MAKDAGQEQVLEGAEQLTNAEKGKFYKQLGDLLQQGGSISQIFQQSMQKGAVNVSQEGFKPLDMASEVLQIADSDEDLKRNEEFRQKGRELIADGKVGVCILGGGAGTRLGLDGPKGLFKIPGLPSETSLYGIFASRIKKLSQGTIPLLVMTSPSNHETTENFFMENKYFGLDKDIVHFFPQGVLPCFTKDGKWILEKPGVIATSPDGNGGIYNALDKSGSLSFMENLGVEWLHVIGVDNVLALPADPLFLGYVGEDGKAFSAGNKSVWKRDAGEKVAFVSVMHVILQSIIQSRKKSREINCREKSLLENHRKYTGKSSEHKTFRKESDHESGLAKISRVTHSANPPTSSLWATSCCSVPSDVTRCHRPRLGRQLHRRGSRTTESNSPGTTKTTTNGRGRCGNGPGTSSLESQAETSSRR